MQSVNSHVLVKVGFLIVFVLFILLIHATICYPSEGVAGTTTKLIAFDLGSVSFGLFFLV